VSTAAPPLTIEDLGDKLDAVLDRLSSSALLPRFFSVPAAAEYVSVSDESIRHLLAAGKLTALHPVPGRVVIDRQELEALILSSNQRLRKGRGIRK
jgi:excisionase family DNA binding protein